MNKMSKLEKTLKYIGIISIIVGILIPLFNIGELKDLKRSADFWEDSYNSNYDNSLIEAEYKYKKNEYDNAFDSVVTLSLSGVISGVLFASMGYLLMHSRNASENAKSTNIVLKELKDYIQKNESDKKDMLVKLEESTRKEQESPVEV